MPPNVLLVVLDSVRARNTSLHGYDFETTPFLSQFADERATQYTQARAPAATSLTSHASLFTGLSVPEHGLTTTDAKLDPGHTVFENLRSAGYETAIFSENTWITEVDVGLNQGFETVVGPQNLPFPSAVDPRQFVATTGQGNYAAYLRETLASDKPLRSLANGIAIKLAYDYPKLLPAVLDSKAPGDVYVESFDRWRAERDSPWAACINLMDAHLPYVPRAEHDRWGGERLRAMQDDIEEQKWSFAGGDRPWWQRRALEGLYDGAIRQSDALVADLVDRLERAGELDDTLLVITADHGEGFGERSHIRPVRIAEHNVAIHEVLTHVPLIVKAPGQDTGNTVEELVSISAFPGAVEAVRSGNQPTFVTDVPVVSTAVGLDEPKRRRAEPYVSDLGPYTAMSRAVYERNGDGTTVKYVTWRDEARTVAVPDVETTFVSAKADRGRVDAVFDELSDAGITESTGGIDEMTAETREQLEDLGYV